MNYLFDEKCGDFTIKDPETGKDWSNQFFNDKSYITTVTHFGGTLSRYVNKDSVQVTLNTPHSSFIYLRDEGNKKYWNVTKYPSLAPVRNYNCTHGQQYTKISSEYDGIVASVTYAIAPNDTREVWRVELNNRSKLKKTLSVFATTAFDLNGYAQPVYYSAVTCSSTRFVEKANAVYNENLNPYRPHELSNGYILSSHPVCAYDGNLEKFIGTMGTFTKPLVLEKGIDCTNSSATVRTRAGILQNKIELEPGEKTEIYYILGLIDGEETLIDKSKAFIEDAPVIIEQAMNSFSRFGNLRTHCPDAQFNRIMNYWAEHQVSYCMLGKKAVRDNAQLGMSMLNFNVELAKKTIDECMKHQYSDGHAVLTWYPYLEPNIYSDPSAWLIFAACEYVKETGDFAWLKEVVPFLDGGEASVYEHLKRAVEWFNAPSNYGAHGLPLIHHADWNDALNIPDEKAESVFMAMLIAKTYSELSELALAIDDNELSNQVLQKKQELASHVNKVAFNGDYYVRAFSKFGVVGDKGDANGGEIYVNTQSWAILSGVVMPERLDKILQAIDSMETSEGIPLCSPPYKTYDKNVGRMSGMLPGVYENGGIYNHAGCFKVMSDCYLRLGDRAYNTLKKIIPGGENNPSKVTTTEPYVFTNCYLKHPSVDMQVGFSWQTGTSAWGLMCYYEGILGLKRSYKGLKVQPSLPKDWKTVTAERNYRGNRLLIRYYNEGGNHVKLSVDGKPIEGDTIPLFDDQLPHRISVTITN